ncbi:propionyl-CoA carboxylase alpha chain, mitochondrial, partial [Tachysurus ichikawai]
VEIDGEKVDVSGEWNLASTLLPLTINNTHRVLQCLSRSAAGEITLQYLGTSNLEVLRMCALSMWDTLKTPLVVRDAGQSSSVLNAITGAASGHSVRSEVTQAALVAFCPVLRRDSGSLLRI